MPDYPLTPGTLPSNCWPPTPQELYNQMFELGFVSLTLRGVIFSNTVPGVSDRDRLWVKLDGSGLPVRQFIYASSLWLWPHPTPASSSERRLWMGTTVALQTYDGGDTSAVTATAGPMWEVDTDFAARSPLGVGTLPGSGTVIAVGDTYGEDQHTQTVAELATHHHDFRHGTGVTVPMVGNVSTGSTTADSATYVLDTGSSTPFNVTHPVKGCYIIKRTARVFYVGT